MLDHAYFQGLWLIILDRKDLSVVHSKNYKTHTEGPIEILRDGGGTAFKNYQTGENIKFIDTFRYSHEMASEIKKHGYDKFVIVVSQYYWE